MRLSLRRFVVDPLDDLLRWIYEGLYEVEQMLKEMYIDGTPSLGMTVTDNVALPIMGEVQTLVWVCFVVLAMIGGILVMTHETIHTRYMWRDVVPRLVIAMGLVAFARPLLETVELWSSDIADALVHLEDGELHHEGFRDGKWAPIDLIDALLQLLGVQYKADFTFSMVFEIFGKLVVVIVLVVTKFLRTIAWVGVVILAPLCLACHGLPFTERVAVWWWRMIAACAGSLVGQCAVFWLWSRVAFDDDGKAIGDSFSNHDLGMDVMYLFVVGWAAWKVHAVAFSWATGRNVSFPGARLAKGLAVGAAVGGIHQAWRRWRKGPSTRPTNTATDTALPENQRPTWAVSRGWPTGRTKLGGGRFGLGKQSQTRDILTRTSKIDHDGAKRAKANAGKAKPPIAPRGAQSPVLVGTRRTDAHRPPATRHTAATPSLAKATGATDTAPVPRSRTGARATTTPSTSAQGRQPSSEAFGTAQTNLRDAERRGTNQRVRRRVYPDGTTRTVPPRTTRGDQQ